MSSDACDLVAAGTAEWALRYLERMESSFDSWQTDCFRRGCGFLARGVVRGAATSWDGMQLPEEDRPAPVTVPMVVQPLTHAEADRLRWMLSRLAGASAQPQVAMAG